MLTLAFGLFTSGPSKVNGNFTAPDQLLQYFVPADLCPNKLFLQEKLILVAKSSRRRPLTNNCLKRLDWLNLL